MHPTLRIFGSLNDVIFSIMTGTSTVRFHLLGTLSHEPLILYIQEIRCLEVLRDEEDTARSPCDCDYAFNDVKPDEI
jgi:hypothetical protein